MDQPGKVANPARGQLNREIIFPCPRACLRIWSREAGSAVPSRVSLLISILRLNLVLTYGIPPKYGTTYFLRLSDPKKHNNILNIWISVLPNIIRHIISTAMQKITVLTVKQPKTRRYRIFFVNANRDDDARSRFGTAVHASGTSQSLPSPFVPASENCGHGRKNTTIESRQTQGKTSKQYMRQNIYLFRKVMISLLMSPGQTACFVRLTVL